MLINIPSIISPELLAVLCEMGHSDTIVLGDGNFPGASIAKERGAKFIRADGHGIPELLSAILKVIPTDSYVDTPVMLMQKMDCDSELDIPIWKEYERIAGKDVIGFYERFEFYEQAKKAYCVVQTSEPAIYANVLVQKGIIKA